MLSRDTGFLVPADKQGVTLGPSSKVVESFPFRLLIGRFLYPTLFSVHHGFFVTVPVKGVNELGKGSSLLHQLLIGARLRHPAILHHQNQVGLGQEAKPVSHQNPGLRQKTKEEQRLKYSVLYMSAHQMAQKWLLLLSSF